MSIWAAHTVLEQSLRQTAKWALILKLHLEKMISLRAYREGSVPILQVA